MATDISVTVPVGKNPIYKGYLSDCIESILSQTYLPNDVVLVDDGTDYLTYEFVGGLTSKKAHATELQWQNSFATCFILSVLDPNKVIRFLIYKTPHPCGVADAFNFGISLAENNLVFMLGSDDKLMPSCLEEVIKEYEKQNKQDGWYNVTVKTASGQEQWIPNNAAAVTRGLWKWLGGFPPSAGVAACDALLLSILIKHAPDRIIQVKQGTPLCWLREHEQQDTRKNMAYFALSGVVESIRNLETMRFVPKGTLE